MDEDINIKKCTECEYKTSSEGRIEMHKSENHQDLYTYQHIECATTCQMETWS